MKIFLVLAAATAVAVAAPTVTNPQLYGIKRTKKSAYGAPCAGGAPLPPIALYLAPQAPQAGLHYREDENTLDEHDHHSARSYYDSGAGAAAAAASSSSLGSLNLNTPASSGPAVGLFPNAKVGGCAVPLLLSCAPNVVSGHIVKHTQAYAPSGYGAPAAAPAYRNGEANVTEMREASEQSWSEVPHSAHQHAFHPAGKGAMQSPSDAPAHHTHNLSDNVKNNSQML